MNTKHQPNFQVGDIITNPWVEPVCQRMNGTWKQNPMYTVIYLGGDSILTSEGTIHKMYFEEDTAHHWKKIGRCDFKDAILKAFATERSKEHEETQARLRSAQSEGECR